MSVSKKLFSRKELLKLIFPLIVELGLTLLVGMIDSVIAGYGRAYITDGICTHCRGGVDLVVDFCASGIHAGSRRREICHDNIHYFHVDIPHWGGISVSRDLRSRSSWRMACHGL